LAQLACTMAFALPMPVHAQNTSATVGDSSTFWWRRQAPDSFRVRVETSRGVFVLAITRALAPRGVDRFQQLVRAGFFDDSRFSRVVPGFIAQFGIPGRPETLATWPAPSFPDDSVRASNVRGAIAFAMTGPDTRTHQLFISLVDNSRLDAQGFAPIGRVIEGMDVVDALYGGYGETSGGGMRAGRQQRVFAEGNRYLDSDFPLLDRLLRARVVERRRGGS
jgi:cyclophilin family peptidyl-prolyl cis-trans isomerase